MDTKKRPPQVAVKHAITAAVLEHTKKLSNTDAPKHMYFPNGWHKIIEKAVDAVYDNYQNSELGKIEVELERLSNAFK